MEDNIKITAFNFLDYQEIEELKTQGSVYKENLVKTIKENLLEQLMEKTENDINLDLAFRIKVELQDEMNLVGKIEQIPINHLVFEFPKMPDFPTVEYHPAKLNLKQRLKVLLKGRL